MEVINILNKSEILFKENFIQDNILLLNIKEYIEYIFKENDISLENYIINGKTKSQEAYWLGKRDYKYGRYKVLKKTPNHIKIFHPFIDKLARLIETENNYIKGYFNSCYINKYNNGGISKHHDNDNIFKLDKSFQGGNEIVVAVFSIGSDTNINIYNEYKDKNPINSIKTKNNFLYIMEKNFQNNFYHEVKKSKGIRYSFTFRHCY